MDLKIISGGQTGVDRGALDAALEMAAPCGGWCPQGRKAEDGVIDARYPLSEMGSIDYIKRTKQNVIDSDATLIIYFSEIEGGTARTVEFCQRLSKPCYLIDAAVELAEDAVLKLQEFIEKKDIRKLNVAGPRGSKQPAACQYTKMVITGLLGKFMQ